MSEGRKFYINFKYFQKFSTTRVTVAIASIALLAVIIISPLALEAVAAVFNLNWVRLSNIGQAYGAVSALIAGFALAGVAASVFLQARETRYNRRDGDRVRHFELMRMAVEDSFYRQVFALPEMSEEEASLTGYINLLFYHWSIVWEFRDIPERTLRSILSDVLFSDAGRAYWKRTRDGWMETAWTKRQIQFCHIADLVYQESISLSSTPDQGVDRTPQRNFLDQKNTLSAFIVGAIIGALSVRALTAKRRPRTTGTMPP
jgi:hypothetical protein